MFSSHYLREQSKGMESVISRVEHVAITAFSVELELRPLLDLFNKPPGVVPNDYMY